MNRHVPNTANLQVAPPPALLPYQQEWIADKSGFKIMEKGRRTGVTWAEAADDVLIAASTKTAGGQNVYYIGTEKEMTEEYIQACEMWARVFNHAASEIEQGIWEEDEEDKNILTYTIRFPSSGNKIVALASRPRKLRGRQGVLVGDEAAFQDDLEELLKAAIAFRIWGGKVRLISTHDGVENQFNDLINLVKAGKRKASLHKITFKGAVAQGLYDRIALRLGEKWARENPPERFVADIYDEYGEAAAEELDCIPRNSGGRYLSMALIESRQSADTPILRLNCRDGFETLPEHIRQAQIRDWCEEHLLQLLSALPETARSYVGEDFARSGDLSVVVPLLMGADLVRREPFHVELRNVPFRQQEQVFFYIVDRLPNFMHGKLDARGNGQYLAEVAMQRYGEARIEQVMLTEKWYGENLPHMKAGLEDGTLEDLPRHEDVMSDLRAFEIIRGVPRIPERKARGKDGGQRHGDYGVALALAHAASRQEVAPIEYMTADDTRLGYRLDDYLG